MKNPYTSPLTIDDIISTVELIDKRPKARGEFGQAYDIVKLMEEVGEFSTDFLKLEGYKVNDEDKDEIRKNMKSEIADILIMLFVNAYKAGLDKDELIAMVDKKLKKWVKKHIEPVITKEEVLQKVMNAFNGRSNTPVTLKMKDRISDFITNDEDRSLFAIQLENEFCAGFGPDTNEFETFGELVKYILNYYGE